MTRAIGYLRCSTIDQSREGVSLEVQREKIQAYAAMRGFSIAELVEDAAVSGSVPLADRREGRRLTAALKAHGASHVVALKLG